MPRGGGTTLWATSALASKPSGQLTPLLLDPLGFYATGLGPRQGQLTPLISLEVYVCISVVYACRACVNQSCLIVVHHHMLNTLMPTVIAYVPGQRRAVAVPGQRRRVIHEKSCACGCEGVKHCQCWGNATKAMGSMVQTILLDVVRHHISCWLKIGPFVLQRCRPARSNAQMFHHYQQCHRHSNRHA